jgi:hypothetical protein
MTTAVLNGESKGDIQLLVELAKKIGIKARILNQEEMEDIGMGYAILEGETGEYVDTEKFLNELKNETSD